ncbi:MAG TPA: TerB family tellurite resistance protein [Polyangiaceae bacterium LLY-WYZ-15_(1-7)]|nr:hypothetical protein [Myxococcales bacterium]MAT26454.1 hypothetical protein [Sandaracinus sp.]HJK94741.1 TerB family tellurite resistance protein [Polyangiaceae bacterium LLY-WYZ-15_(1-7)]MBJ75008.1 hypothetical protein [Sandaracinus sp.]HJL03660.1 TerB family tellurite resistance protein [Polyangiaceae bacterium LLY-WYZ-15_(1-7)]
MSTDLDAARTSWAELDAVDDTLVQAVAAAFALVATADRELADAEVDRFLQVLADDPAFEAVDASAIGPQFRALAQAVLDRPEEGWLVALSRLQKVEPERIDHVIRAAQIAIVADGALHPQEEAALRRICEALGIDPDAA